MLAEKSRKTCFVIMGFGKKTDFATGRTLDLDKTYMSIIKPAVQDAGLICVRADEIVHSGLIDVPMYEQLLTADVVIADLSTASTNTLYELGVRHALRPSTTLIIAEDNFYAVPFDVAAITVMRYRHLGEGIDFAEVMRFRKELTDAVKKAASGEESSGIDSPVYMYLPGLRPPTMPGDADTRAVPSEAADGGVPPPDDLLLNLMKQADAAEKEGDFVTARNVLTLARDVIKPAAPRSFEDPYIIQRLALVTYKSKQPTPQAALEEARDLLATLDPATSNDPETLGLWGAVHKRLWELTGDTKHLDEAVHSYERGFYLRNDYYNGINLAFLLNVRAAAAQRRAREAAAPEESAAARAESVADFVQAERVRREVLSICEQWLAQNPPPDGGKASPQTKSVHVSDRYWVLATVAEAHVGLGDARAQQKLDEAFAAAPTEWMKESTREQIEKLRALLSDSPLKSL